MNKKEFVFGIIIALISLLTGCRAQQATTQHTATDYHFRDTTKMVYELDSVFLHDSIFVNHYVRGDTVFRESVRTRNVFKWRDRHDTVTVMSRDTVTLVEVQTVEKKVTDYKYRTRWYDNICRRVTVGIIIALLLTLLIWLCKKGL